MHIRVYETDEAKRLGLKYEHMLVLEEFDAGMILGKGKDHTIFLPWEYLIKHSYRYIN